jgi:hypothetical protein
MSLMHKYLYSIPFTTAAANSRRKRASFTVKKESIRVDSPWPGAMLAPGNRGFLGS